MPPLHFLQSRHAAQAQHADLVRRSRLLFNRSFLRPVLQRFPNSSLQPAVAATTLCPHPECEARQLDETVEHLLLHCPRHRAARDRLRTALAQADSSLTLTLRNILNPPTGGRAKYSLLYNVTNTFLASIDTTRLQHQQQPLDAYPIQPHTAASSQPTQQQLANAQAASAAPSPLDTG